MREVHEDLQGAASGDGGGGYTKSNVARCWTYETAALLDREISADIPEHDFYYEYYADVEYKMKVQPTNYIENLNTKSYLQDIQQKVLENLRALEHAPGVAMHEVPPDSMLPEFDEDDLNCDERNGGETGRRRANFPRRRVLRRRRRPGQVAL